MKSFAAVHFLSIPSKGATMASSIRSRTRQEILGTGNPEGDLETESDEHRRRTVRALYRTLALLSILIIGVTCGYVLMIL